MDEKQPKFGPFKIDHRNWLDSLNPDREGALTEKPYVKIIYEIRLKLRQSLGEIPPCPDHIKTLDEFFTEAEKVVNEKWLKYVSGLFDEYRQEWLSKTTEHEEEYKELRAVLSNKNAFEQSLRSYQLGSLEQLRSIAPDGWYKLILASSERQLALNWLCNYWEKNSKDLPEKIGMSTDEIKLILEIGTTFTKYFNIAFLKQTELADTPGGSSVTPLSDQPGASYLYDIYKGDGSESFEVKTYGEMFRHEWGRIVLHFNRLAEKTKKLIDDGKIPNSYKKLPDYLKLLAEVHGSKEKDPEKLVQMWNGLDKSCKELAESGCPVSIIGQGTAMVAGEANKIDIELRVGLRDEKAQILEKALGAFHAIAQNIADEKINAPSERFVIPAPKVSRQIYSFGTNLVWETPADTRTELTNIHYNTISRGAAEMKLILDKLLPENPMANEKYENAFTEAIGLHELGHGILPTQNSSVTAKIGTSDEANILEELKAETDSFIILKKCSEKGQEIDFEAHALAKIAFIITYLLKMSPEKGSATERYYYAGIAMLKKLLDDGALQKKDNGYKINNPNQVIESIANVGNEVLSQFYENPDSKPGDAQKFGKELREAKSDPKISEFLEALQKIR
jgi:hypothetical protein